MVNRASWDDDPPNWVERGRTSWAREPSWGIWAFRNRSSAYCPTTWLVSTPSRSGAGPGTYRPGSPGGVRGRWGSTTRADSSLRHSCSRTSSTCTSRSTTPSRSTARRSGATRTGGRGRARPSTRGPPAVRPGDAAAADGLSNRRRQRAGRGDAASRLLRDAPRRVARRRENVDAIEFNLTHGDMIRLLRSNGLEVEDLLEI